MENLTFTGHAAAWWPFVFILLAGWLPTDVWRYLGTLTAGKIDDHSPMAALARTIATSLVAAVIGQLVLFPTGSLAEIPTILRVGALAIGLAAYLLAGRRVVVGILAAEAVLLGGVFLA